MKHSSNCIEKGVKHAFSNSILMGGVPDGVLMDDTMVMAVLICDKFGKSTDGLKAN